MNPIFGYNSFIDNRVLETRLIRRVKFSVFWILLPEIEINWPHSKRDLAAG
jgi:hypothetical protein